MERRLRRINGDAIRKNTCRPVILKMRVAPPKSLQENKQFGQARISQGIVSQTVILSILKKLAPARTFR
jgi:hypothetical protein